MKRWLAVVLILLGWGMTGIAQMTSGGMSPAASAQREPVVRRIEKGRDAHVLQRIELVRNRLPEEFQRRRNFAWAVVKVEGSAAREYFAHSGIQNLKHMSGQAAKQIQGISLRPRNPQFETLCINRNDAVNGPDCWDRSVDTEFKIIEDFAGPLGNSTEVAGRMRLYTDLPPCASCKNVMRQFLQKYPNIQLEVLYRD